MNGQRRVVVTGLGVMAPLGPDPGTFLENLLAGRSGIVPITRWDASAHASRIAGEVQGTVFRPEDHFSRQQLRRLDPFCQIGLAAARQAMADAGLAEGVEGVCPPPRAGSIFGTGMGGIVTILDTQKVLENSGPRRVTPFFVPATMANALAGNAAIEFGLQGPCFTTASACASSGHALGMALREIRSGAADLMLAGGAEAVVVPLCVAGFNSLRALSTRNDTPEQASRPFDRDRDGFVIGEGAGALVLEELEHARARGARIYCELAGFGQSDDAGHITAPDATARRPAAAMSSALEDAGMDPSEVDYVNAHGTSTALNDAMETRAIKIALGEEQARRVAVSSTKSMIGHLIGAASAVEAVACVKMIEGQVVHPTRNCEHPDVENGCDLDYVPEGAREMEIRGVLSNSFGFGGHNVSLAFRRL